MEFYEKLQDLRKRKGLTQEELAQALYVSRTAVSKWESGRGYPNIDSLKAIAIFFSVTVDELLSGDEFLTIAEAEQKEIKIHAYDLVFGLLDLSCVTFFFAPFFGQKTAGTVQSVSLISLTEISQYMRIAYFAIVIGMCLSGVLTLLLRNYREKLWTRGKRAVSLLINGCGALLFIISPQPYAAAFLFVFLIVKAAMLIKKQ